MTLYYRSEQQRKVYKLIQTTSNEGTKVLIYWVSIYSTEGGGFFHGRGADVVESLEMGQKMLEYLGKPTTEKDYIDSLKDYFAADKKVREQFIKAYNL